MANCHCTKLLYLPMYFILLDLVRNGAFVGTCSFRHKSHCKPVSLSPKVSRYATVTLARQSLGAWTLNPKVAQKRRVFACFLFDHREQVSRKRHLVLSATLSRQWPFRDTFSTTRWKHRTKFKPRRLCPSYLAIPCVRFACPYVSDNGWFRSEFPTLWQPCLWTCVGRSMSGSNS